MPEADTTFELLAAQRLLVEPARLAGPAGFT